MRSNLLKRCDIWVKEYNCNANILLLSPKLKPPEKASDITFDDFLRLKVHNPLGWKVNSRKETSQFANRQCEGMHLTDVLSEWNNTIVTLIFSCFLPSRNHQERLPTSPLATSCDWRCTIHLVEKSSDKINFSICKQTTWSNALNRCDIWVKCYNCNVNILSLSLKQKSLMRASDIAFGKFPSAKAHNSHSWIVIYRK